MVDRRREEKGIELESQKYNNRYPLSSKVICGNCGGTYKRKTYSKKVVLACTMHIEDKDKCDMKYIDLADVERAFATMMNKLIFGRNRVLKPFYASVRDSNKTDAFLRIHEIDEQLELITEKKQNIKGLYAQRIIEPAMYAKGMNDLSAEADRLLTERDSISYVAKSDIVFIEEVKELLDYTDGAAMLTGFEADVFERFVDRIVVRDRHHLEFEMKCGLKLTERI